MNAYANDNQVRRLTLEAIERTGTRIFQIHKLATTDRAHVGKLLELFDPPPSARVIDAGCGVGGVAALMAECRPDLDWLLLNISHQQLALCPEGFCKVAGRLDDMPLADASADAVMINYAIGHVGLDRAMAEVARVLREGGVLFVYDICAEHTRRLEAMLAYRAPRLGDVIARAEAHGLTCCFADELKNTHMGDFYRLMPPEEAAMVLDNVTPAIFRFTKRSPCGRRRANG